LTRFSTSPDADTKPFAQRMVQDHQTTSQELKALVDSSKVKATLPIALDDKPQKMLDDLRAKNGKDFDQAYDHAQQQTHQEAVDLFEKYADGGDNADLKKWAAKTLPHLKSIWQWRRSSSSPAGRRRPEPPLTIFWNTAGSR
jgi:putative membrane protein